MTTDAARIGHHPKKYLIITKRAKPVLPVLPFLLYKFYGLLFSKRINNISRFAADNNRRL
jgi:hypothetical protein